MVGLDSSGLDSTVYIWLELERRVLVYMGPGRRCTGRALVLGRHMLVCKLALGSLSIVHMCGGCLRGTLRERSPGSQSN